MSDPSWGKINEARLLGLVSDHELSLARASRAGFHSLAATCLARLEKRKEKKKRTEVKPLPDGRYEVDVVLNYHRETLQRWLVPAIESVVHQNMCDVTLHLTFDSAGEEDRVLPEEYRSASGIRTYRTVDVSENVGPYVITNIVSRHFTSDCFMVQDADDISTPNRARLSCEQMFSSGAAVVGGHMDQFIDRDHIGHELMERLLKARPQYRSGLVWRLSPFPDSIHGASVFRLGPFLSLNGYMRLLAGADTEFVMRLHAAGYSACVVDEVFGFRRLVSTSLSHCEQYGWPHQNATRDACYEAIENTVATSCLDKLRSYGSLQKDRMEYRVERLS